MSTPPTRTAASTARSTAARPGKRSCSRTTVWAPSISRSIPGIPASSTPRCGPRAVRHGRFTLLPTCPEADSINPSMAAIPGSNWRADFPPTSSSVRSASPSRPAIPIASGPWWTIPVLASPPADAAPAVPRGRAESTSPATPAPPGNWSTPKPGCGAAAGSSAASTWIPLIPTAPTS